MAPSSQLGRGLVGRMGTSSVDKLYWLLLVFGNLLAELLLTSSVVSFFIVFFKVGFSHLKMTKTKKFKFVFTRGTD